MKTTNKVVLVAIGISALALATGCIYEEPGPPAPGVAVTGFVPDDCFWDGYEYVGWYGDQYYYWGPGNVWVVCDPGRVQRVNVWVRAHPDWRARVTPAAQYRVNRVNVNKNQVRPQHVPPVRHGYYDRDDRH